MFGAGHIGINHRLDLAAFPQSVIALQNNLPDTAANRLKRVTGLIPVVEITGQVQLIGTGRPFAVDPTAIEMMDSEVMMRIGKILQRTATTQKPFFRLLIEFHTQIDVIFKRL